jgi:hypothetical protein
VAFFTGACSVVTVLSHWNYVLTLACLAVLVLTACSYSLAPHLLLEKELCNLCEEENKSLLINAEHQQVLPITRGAHFVLQILLEASNWLEMLLGKSNSRRTKQGSLHKQLRHTTMLW